MDIGKAVRVFAPAIAIALLPPFCGTVEKPFDRLGEAGFSEAVGSVKKQ